MLRNLLLALMLTPLAVPVQAADSLSLAGTWRFQLDPERIGETQRWFGQDLAQRIALPGTTDEAKRGLPNRAPPTLMGLYRPNTYAGPAWYQRDIEIPESWRGKRILLYLERVHWETRVWLDGNPVGVAEDSLVTPHVHDLGSIAPGRHRLTLRVDNTLRFDLGEFVSIYSEHTQTNWNGVVGRIELAATAPVWIDGVQVYPDVTRKRAHVVVEIANATGAAGHGIVRIGGAASREIEAAWGPKAGRVEADVAIGDARLWDEFAPNLHELTVQLGGQERRVRFGMRELGVRGTQFTMNGRTIYLRGDVECAIFPRTGYPAMDVPAWRRICRTIKAYGLNHLRFHSWTPPEAAFTAADEEGVLLQVEGPQANVSQGQIAGRDAFIAREIRRILRAYGNHPSFCFLSMGNELTGKAEVLADLVAFCREQDSRHLYTSVSNGLTTANRQYTVATVRGIGGEGTAHDFRAATGQEGLPLVSHEVGQWTVYPNFAEMKKYSGVLEPRNFALVRESLASKGMLDLAPQFVEATGRLAALLYKEECEVLLRTPGHAGFQLLSLRDYPGTGMALVGLLDPFWDSKGLIAPEPFRRFCGPTVPLLRLQRRTWETGATLAAEAEVAHFGSTDLAAVEPIWSIHDDRGTEIAAGSLPLQTVRTGALTKLGKIEAVLGRVHAPAKLRVSLRLKNTPFENDWEIWVYPSIAEPLAAPAGVVISRQWDGATAAALAQGRKVLLLSSGHTPASVPGRFLPVFWSPIWFPDQQTMGILCDPHHPALALFPTEFHSNWQWLDLLNHSRAMVLDDLPPDYRPIVQVIDDFAHHRRLGNLFEARVGQGRLLVSSIDFGDVEHRPAARQLLRSLYAYTASETFRPRYTLEPAALARLFPESSSVLKKLGARVVRADSEVEGYEARLAIDGDPATFWCTPWGKRETRFPHELVIDLTKTFRLRGFTLLPRQDGNPNGWVKDYAIHVSVDGANWGRPVAEGSCHRGTGMTRVILKQPTEARFVKLIALHAFDNQPYASLAEFDVQTDK